MHEAMLVMMALVALGVLGMLAETIAASSLVEVGFWCLGSGLALGLPAGFWYHYRLYQALVKRGPVPSRWWLSPSDFHSILAAQEFATIKPWYVLGALSFTVAFAGGLAALAGLLHLRPM